MSFGVPLGSKKLVAPVHLENRSTGRKLEGSFSKTDVASAMVVFGDADGRFHEEFFPLKLVPEKHVPYDGREWELFSDKVGEGIHAHYLGIPDSILSHERGYRSLAIEVVGSSGFTGNLGYSGGLDLHLQESAAVSLVPSFLNLCERFFPSYLPPNFVTDHLLDRWEYEGESHLLLKINLKLDSRARIPVSFEKHWEPKRWLEAVVENILPETESRTFFTIRSGCFYSRARRLSHWFGSGFRNDEKDFRLKAAQAIAKMGKTKDGAWIFWVHPHSGAGAERLLNALEFPRAGTAPVSVRHPMLGYLATRKGGPQKAQVLERLDKSLSFARLPIPEALDILAETAKLLLRFQHISHRFTPAISGERSDMQPQGVSAPEFESAIQQLYHRHGEKLKSLEASFDDFYGFAAWDTVGQSMRQMLGSYLEEAGKTSAS